MNQFELETCPELSYREIQLTKGKVALVSIEDFERLSRGKWYALESSKTGLWYAFHRIVRGDGKSVIQGMHRDVLGLLPGDKRLADHIRRLDTLDNRRSNLRIATRSQNGMNRTTPAHNSSGIKGVSYDKDREKWRVQIQAHGKHYTKTGFLTKEAAEEEAVKLAAQLHGQFASR